MVHLKLKMILKSFARRKINLIGQGHVLVICQKLHSKNNPFCDGLPKGRYEENAKGYVLPPKKSG